MHRPECSAFTWYRLILFLREPASASPTGNDSRQPTMPYNDFSANGNNPLNFVSQPKGALQFRPLPLVALYVPAPLASATTGLRIILRARPGSGVTGTAGSRRRCPVAISAELSALATCARSPAVRRPVQCAPLRLVPPHRPESDRQGCLDKSPPNRASSAASSRLSRASCCPENIVSMTKLTDPTFSAVSPNAAAIPTTKAAAAATTPTPKRY